MDRNLKYGLARKFRKSMSPPEVRMWVRLRKRTETGFVIRRQHPVGPYVLDFYCPEAKLAIEVDGVQHTFEREPARDETRDAWLSAKGIETLRVPAVNVMQDADGAAEGVFEFIRLRAGPRPES